MRKQDKKHRHYYRSADRLYEADGAWYYETREANQGPFESREAAQNDLERFLAQSAAGPVASRGPTEPSADKALLKGAAGEDSAGAGSVADGHGKSRSFKD